MESYFHILNPVGFSKIPDFEAGTPEVVWSIQTRHLKVCMEFHMKNSMIILRKKKENNEVLVVSQVNKTIERRVT